MLRYIFLFMHMLFVLEAAGQQGMPVFINFTTRHGLAGNETHRVIQDIR